ncbi:MAG TPA: hypothetical protein VF806_09595 [Anaerolineaceae bacterium]
MVTLTQTPEQTSLADPNMPVHPLRMIVLVPGLLIDPAGFSQMVYHMAFQQKREVLYLALADQEGDLLARDRMLASLKSVTDDPRIKVRTLTLETGSWVEAVRFVYQPGDVVVCHAAQQVHAGWRGPVGLGEYLDTQYRIRVHILSGFYRPEPERDARAWSATLIWLSLLATLILFTYLEVRMEDLLTGGIKTLILLALVGLEFGIFFKLNNLSN